jgi:hypothetical protein
MSIWCVNRMVAYQPKEGSDFSWDDVDIRILRRETLALISGNPAATAPVAPSRSTALKSVACFRPGFRMSLWRPFGPWSVPTFPRRRRSPMTKPGLASLLVLTGALLIASAARSRAEAPATEGDAQRPAIDAYIYGYPLVTMPS